MNRSQNVDNSDSPRNFDPDKAFFVIDSDNLDQVKSELYGYCFVNSAIIQDIEALSDSEPNEDGAYIYIKRDGNIITIKQDFAGCYGLYLYTGKDYFAISNSFIYLVDYIKIRRRITLNKNYADYFLTVGFCSISYSETMINEISLLDRSAVIAIDIANRSMSVSYMDYKENTVDLDSEEGIKILDNWYSKWASIIKSLYEHDADIIVDLSGGFDSRISFLLVLASGIDLNKIMVRSKNNNVNSRSQMEDYKIASEISKFFDFQLNDRQVISQDKYRYSSNDTFNISLYLRGCFHKQMMFITEYYKKCRYQIGGVGGECIKAFPSYLKSEKFIMNSAVNQSKKYQFTTKQTEIEMSIRKILQNTFTEIHKKYDLLRRSLSDPVDFARTLYRETRNRNHFGSYTLIRYFSNTLTISPLLDKDLAMLSSSTENDSDGDLIYAVIFDRYCRKLLDFEFNGNCTFGDSTLQCAKEINTKFPYGKSLYLQNIDIKIKEKDVYMHDIGPASDKTPNKLIRSAFCSDKIKSLFLKYYDEKVYKYILKDRMYHSSMNLHAVLEICEILEAVSVNRSIFSDPSDFIIGCADDI